MVRSTLIIFLSLTAFAAQAETPREKSPPGSLSDKLDRSDGIIKPPGGIDPKMSKPAPDQHPSSMPIVPPPGSPGGRRDVEPK